MIDLAVPLSHAVALACLMAAAVAYRSGLAIVCGAALGAGIIWLGHVHPLAAILLIGTASVVLVGAVLVNRWRFTSDMRRVGEWRRG
jgi:hypothetical protein